MKKALALVLFAIILISTISACSTNRKEPENPVFTPKEPTITEPLDTSENNIPKENIIQNNTVPQDDIQQLLFERADMPVPFAREGGDANLLFIEVCDPKISHIWFELTRYFVEYFEYSNYRDLLLRWTDWPYDISDAIGFSSIMDFPNNFSIIIANNIPDEVVIDSIEKMNARFMETMTNPDVLEYTIFNEEDIRTLLSRDESTVLNRFAYEQSIVIEDRVFSPEWVYYHTTNAYAEAGITPPNARRKTGAVRRV